MVHQPEKPTEPQVSEQRSVEPPLGQKQQLFERLLSANERERQLVAYEIHDTFLQDMIGALMQLESVCQRHGNLAEGELKQVETARDLLRKAIEEARHLIGGLRASPLENQGLIEALGQLVNQVNDRGFEIELKSPPSVERLPAWQELTLFRIAQEALRNLARHSKSRKGRVTFSRDADRLRLEVRDWGAGFDQANVPKGHFGLEAMKERARLAGGTLEIASAPGEGTTVTAEMPIG